MTEEDRGLIRDMFLENARIIAEMKKEINEFYEKTPVFVSFDVLENKVCHHLTVIPAIEATRASQAVNELLTEGMLGVIEKKDGSEVLYGLSDDVENAIDDPRYVNHVITVFSKTEEAEVKNEQ